MPASPILEYFLRHEDESPRSSNTLPSDILHMYLLILLLLRCILRSISQSRDEAQCQCPISPIIADVLKVFNHIVLSTTLDTAISTLHIVVMSNQPTKNQPEWKRWRNRINTRVIQRDSSLGQWLCEGKQYLRNNHFSNVAIKSCQPNCVM